jgi:uncharacterized protein (DUF697 family)
MPLPVSAGAVRKLLREVAASEAGEHVLAVGGAREHAPLLRQQFLRGHADPGAVRFGDPEHATVYVHVLAGAPGEDDVAVLRRARRAAVPIVAVVVGSAEDTTIPYVFATDVIPVGAGQAFPLEEIARAVAVRLGERGAPLAARVPLLRGAVSDRLLGSLARRNSLVTAAVWRSGADRPALTLNELRLVLRLAQAYGAAGEPVDRLPELLAAVSAGFGLRSLARAALALAPGQGWAVNAAVAYAGTRAIGEAARVRFSLAPTRRPGGAVRVGP